MPTAPRDDSSDFGVLLRRLRVAAGLTQEALAERAGLSARGLSDLERGVRAAPRRDTLRLLLDALALGSTEQTALVAAARRSAAAAARPRTVAPRTASAIHNRFPGAELPVPSDPLIGRECDIASVTALIRDPSVRLVTLTGPGGVGKTRLALQVAAALRPDFPGGVAFVPLAAIRDPALVLPAVAQALGVREVPDRPPEDALAIALRARPVLLVLDNLEQALDAVPAVGRLLTAVPALRLLVTSRVALRLSREQRYVVSPLATPELMPNPEGNELPDSPALHLFMRRARQVRPDLALTPESVAAVAAICRRLDGLPLAIELAAARVAVLSPPALMVRLEHVLPLLSDGARDQPERLQGMREAIAWSYDLLPPARQALFRQLAVCESGFTLEVAEAICQARGDAADALFDAVAGLVEASLLRVEDEPAGEPRFTMLETIREYGLEQVAASGEEAQTRERHAAWVLGFAENSEPELFRTDQQKWGERIEAERPNIRAALVWFEQTADAERAQRLAGVLTTFGWLRGHLREGQDWLSRALAIPGETQAATRAWALMGSGMLAFFRRDHDMARAFVEQSLMISRLADFPLGVAMSELNLAADAWARGELQRAQALGEKAIVGLRKVGHLGFLAIALGDMGTVALLNGDIARGESWSAEGLTLNRALGNRWFIANNLSDLGAVEQSRGDLAKAAQHYAESARALYEVGDTWFIAYPLAGLASIAVAHGHAESAARLLAKATALQEASGSPSWAAEQARDAQTAATARAMLGEAAFAQALKTGQELSLEQVIENALDIVDDVANALQ
jgi:predicted ATPase/transcriptional regulator with XRE-family HTH domain